MGSDVLCIHSRFPHQTHTHTQTNKENDTHHPQYYSWGKSGIFKNFSQRTMSSLRDTGLPRHIDTLKSHLGTSTSRVNNQRPLLFSGYVFWMFSNFSIHVFRDIEIWHYGKVFWKELSAFVVIFTVKQVVALHKRNQGFFVLHWENYKRTHTHRHKTEESNEMNELKKNHWHPQWPLLRADTPKCTNMESMKNPAWPGRQDLK